MYKYVTTHIVITFTWPDQSRVQGLDPVGGHDDLNVASGVKTIQLVKKLQHGPLNFSLTTRV